jgi:hypothetical protein
VRTVVVVVRQVVCQQPAQVPLVEDHGMIKQFPAHVPDPALCDTVLPRASVGDPRRAQADCLRCGNHPATEDRVSVEDETSEGGIVRERLAQLLDNPRGCGSVRHVEVENAPPGVIDRELDVEDTAPTLERAGTGPLTREVP